VPKVIYNTATSFTGFIADPANSLSWLFEVPRDGAPDHGEFMRPTPSGADYLSGSQARFASQPAFAI
jgi:hypothetical protein